MKFEELTETIIGCAYEVYGELSFGHLESVYENSLDHELSEHGLKVKTQEPINVHYKNHLVGDFYADCLVEDKVILELKSIRNLHERHEVQLVSYLTATRMDVGLLINFGPDGVDVKRKVRELPQ